MKILSVRVGKFSFFNSVLLFREVFLPSKLSSIAPPPVLIKLTSSCKLNFLIAATESPPPINEKAPLLVALATDFAIDKVPFSKAGISKTPIGPFHNIVLLSVTIFSNLDIVKGQYLILANP